jgi:hypothetical protein
MLQRGGHHRFFEVPEPRAELNPADRFARVKHHHRVSRARAVLAGNRCAEQAGRGDPAGQQARSADGQEEVGAASESPVARRRSPSNEETSSACIPVVLRSRRHRRWPGPDCGARSAERLGRSAGPDQRPTIRAHCHGSPRSFFHDIPEQARTPPVILQWERPPTSEIAVLMQ